MTSQVGIVVLSPSFFAKRWTAYELDGLVQLHGGTPEQIAGSEHPSRLLPVWHDVDAAGVARYSPSLANLVALQSGDGVEAVADRILDVLRPAGSTLLVAHSELAELGEPLGWYPPVVTDDWWLDVVEASAGNDVEGTFQEPMGWGHWGFPLPPQSAEPRERGHRLARAAVQMMWQRADSERPICQTTPPEEVLDFIDSHPGLADACLAHPSYVLSYAPQLALPGVGEWFEPLVDEIYEWARNRRASRGGDPDSPVGRRALFDSIGYLVLRDVELVKADPAQAACSWAQGEIHGPPVKIHEIVDYAGWLASHQSAWMGGAMRDALLDGIAKWAVWPSWYNEERPQDAGYHLLDYLGEDPDDASVREKVLPILSKRLKATAELLGLPESGDVLADRLLVAGFVKKYRRRRKGRGKPSNPE